MIKNNPAQTSKHLDPGTFSFAIIRASNQDKHYRGNKSVRNQTKGENYVHVKI